MAKVSKKKGTPSRTAASAKNEKLAEPKKRSRTQPAPRRQETVRPDEISVQPASHSDAKRPVRWRLRIPEWFSFSSNRRLQIGLLVVVGFLLVGVGWFWMKSSPASDELNVRTIVSGETIKFLDEANRFSFSLPAGWSFDGTRGAEAFFSGPDDETLVMMIRTDGQNDPGFAFANFVRLHLGERVDASTLARNIHPISSDERKKYEVDSGYFAMILRKPEEKASAVREHLIAFAKGERVFLFRFAMKDRRDDREKKVDTENALFVFSRTFKAGADN